MFRPYLPRGRIQGRAKIGHGGPHLKKIVFLAQKATATNRMHDSDLEACGDEVLLFLVPFWCQILDAFIVLRWATVAHMGLLLKYFITVDENQIHVWK